jgi:amino acid adenylation domain-containing protein/thioester reductase-like protein
MSNRAYISYSSNATFSSAEEKNKQLFEFNRTKWDYNSEETLLTLFNKAVAKYPQRIAAVFKNDSLSYLELDKKSNQLAATLVERGIKEGMYVPIWLDRSLDWVVAILGIIKTGAAYVPIDPDQPAKRVAYILSDTNAALAITDHLHSQLLKDLPAVPVLLMDDIDSLFSGSAALSTRPPRSETLAYIIYTSGSTGKPKGVMVSHRSIQHLVSWHNQYFDIDCYSRLSLVAGLAFDISVWETWSALISGATLFIADAEERLSADSLVNYYLHNKLTHGFVPTVLVPEFIAATDKSTLALRYLFTAGEKLRPVLTGDLSYKLVDYYGPTECTVYSTFRIVEDVDGKYKASIGRPIANTQAYILNNEQKIMPIGAVGELYLGGEIMAEGYLHNEALTAEKFVNVPFLNNTILYRTGDLARWLPDGEIQYLGRVDNQIKIRGFRIEPGEIERTLTSISGIKEAVVISSSVASNSILIGFIQPEIGHELHTVAIRQQLKNELPSYMVPVYLIVVKKIPLTINGKIDTVELQIMASRAMCEINVPEPPKNDTEWAIANIWSDVLERPGINSSDNFFDIGGNSLLVALVATQIRQQLHCKIHMRDIYQYPVLQDLADMLLERAAIAQSPIAMEDTEPYVELQNDVYLRPGTVFAGNFNPEMLTNPNTIFLTGVTGFVGIHLLQELLDKTDAEIYCLVRAQDKFHALERIKKCFIQYRIPWNYDQEKRIIPILGDLSKPSLGLTEERFDALAEMTDIIYHSGSSVNFIEPYSFMKAANVEGIREIIRFAGAKKTKCLALLSTISVYSWGHVFTKKKVMLETDDISQNLLSVSKDIGYVRSKWVMEAIADLAAREGLPVITYRLGYAMCHSETGASASYQWWAGLLKNCIEFGNYPALRELREGLTTVDYMTKSIVHITKNIDAVGKKFNLIATPETNLTLEDFFGLLNKYYPFALQPLSYKDWRKQWEDNPKNRLYPLTSLFMDNMHEGLSTVELYQDTYAWDCSHVTQFLQGSDIKEPVFDKKLLDVYLQYLEIHTKTTQLDA